MQWLRQMGHRLVPATLALFSLLTVWAPAAQAGMISTDQLAASQHSAQSNQARAQLKALLGRVDIQQQLEKWGVDAQAAQSRVDSMTDQEVLAANKRLGSMPAGGTDILGVAVLLFLILLVTDIAGYTNIFPFVNHPAR